MKLESKELKPNSHELIAVLRHLIANYEAFDLYPDIYGDLRPRCERLIQQLSAL